MTAAGGCLAGLLPELRHVLLWMANAVELLYFVQQQGPVYMQGLEQGPGGSGRPRGGGGRGPGHRPVGLPGPAAPALALSVCTAAHHCEECRGPGWPLRGGPAEQRGPRGPQAPCPGTQALPAALAAPERRQEHAEPCGHVELRARCGDEVLRTRRGGLGGLRGRWLWGALRPRGISGCVSDEDCVGPGRSRAGAGLSAGDRVDSGPRGLGRPQPLSALAKTRLALPCRQDLSLSRLHRNRRGPARGPGLQPGGALGLGGAR